MSRTMVFVSAGALVMGMAFTARAEDDDRISRDRERDRRADATSMTCEQFSALDTAEQRETLAWLDGYSKRETRVGDLGDVDFARDTRALQQACEDSPRDSLRRQLRANAPRAAKGLRPDRMSCKEYGGLDEALQREVMAFADGYSSRGESRSASRSGSSYERDAAEMRRECRENPRSGFWSELGAVSGRRGDVSARPDDRDNVSRMTCSEFRALPAQEQGRIIAWMDGYSRGSRERDLGRADFDRDVSKLIAICEDNPRESLRRQMGSDLPRGRTEILPGRISCSEFSELDRDVQEEVVAFADGYLSRHRSGYASAVENLRQDVAEIRRACRRDPKASFWGQTDLLTSAEEK